MWYIQKVFVSKFRGKLGVKVSNKQSLDSEVFPQGRSWQPALHNMQLASLEKGKYFLQTNANTFCKKYKYLLQINTNMLLQFVEIHFANKHKYILQNNTNTFYNNTIWDKYCKLIQILFWIIQILSTH